MVAPRILWRYIYPDVAQHALLGLSVVAVVLVAAILLQKLEDLLAVGVGLMVMVRLAAIILPSYLVYAVPTALLFGVLISLGRMSADGEIVAMRSAGVSVYRMLPPILALGLLTTLGSAYVTFELEPRSNYEMKSMLRALLEPTAMIEPGRVRTVRSRQTIYVRSIGDASCPLQGIFISDFSDVRRPFYVAARCGLISSGDERSPGLALELIDGSIHFSSQDDTSYRQVDFLRGSTELDLTGALLQTKKLDHYTMAELPGLRGDPKFDRTAISTEIHRRIALPIGSLLLAMLAIPLGIRPVRGGRSAGAITAILVVALYFVVFSAGQIVAENRWAPSWLALWLPNLGAFLGGLALLSRSERGDT